MDMSTFTSFSRSAWSRAIARFALVVFLACVGASAASAKPRVGPCDILKNAGTPCVAAHSTTRALYASYAGPLYEVQRADGKIRDIRPIGAGGFADAAAQDAFCKGSTCTITRIYDQSPQRNDMTVEGPGSAGKTADRGARADALPVTLSGHRVYGIRIDAGMGYRNDTTHAVARNGEPETMLMVTSRFHTNNRCCFDYGNAETDNTDHGPISNGHMDALNFSTICKGNRTCLGDGPWVQADLENGLFMSDQGGNDKSSYRGNATPFVTTLLKNDGRTFFELKSGDGQRGQLTQVYHGQEPMWKPGYSPMQQEGAIVLGTGGDNSNWSTGLFFEGFMTASVTSKQTDDAVQANIVAAGYGGLDRFDEAASN
jgi:hypothetical protein